MRKKNERTPTKREEKEPKILALYPKLKPKYGRASDLYIEIARQAGCGENMVVDVLQDNGIIAPKKSRKNDTSRV